MQKPLLRKITAVLCAVVIIASVASVIFLSDALSRSLKNKPILDVLSVETVEAAKPKNVYDKAFGLHFYSNATTYKRSTESLSEINFDPNKPTVIHVHGVQFNAVTANRNIYLDNEYNELFVNAQGWLDAGWNVGSFFWTQFSNDMPNDCENKWWSRNMGTYTYSDENKKRAFSDDVMTYALAEVFAAYYLGFLEKANFNGPQILLMGHSAGANGMYSVSNYLATLANNGKITKDYLPDRVVFHDAYLQNAPNENVIPWLNRPAGKNGSLGMAIETYQKLYDLGIANEYIKSSTFVSAAYLFVEGAEIFLDDMTAKTRFLDMNVNEHTASPAWFMLYLNTDFIDTTSGGYGVGVNVPLPYIYATRYIKYQQSERVQIENRDVKSDGGAQYSDIQEAKIAGFAFNDANGNGINDDRIKNRVDGIKVKLLSGNAVIAETVTKNGGYYEFVIGASNLGKALTVQVELSSTDFFVAKAVVGDNGNAIKANQKSDAVILNSKQIEIINIGLVKKV